MGIAIQQPDISYHPDFEKYKIRTERLKLVREPNIGLPCGFPAQLTGPLVWEGRDLASESDWTFSLNEAQVLEINQALFYFKALGKPLGHVSQVTFPLPNLKPILRQHAEILHNGRGFFVLRGIPVDKYSVEDNIIVYTGLSSYIGSIRGRQDSKLINGEKRSSMLNHIKDLSQTSVSDQIGAPAYTTDKQVFHTDAGDIVSLLCLGTAAKGGESKLSSSWKVYNELAKTRPDIIKTLAEDWVFDGYGDAVNPYSVRPLLFHEPAQGSFRERIIIQYARRGFTGFLNLPRSPGIPSITEAQAEALDALHFLAEKYSLTLDFQKGDIQFVNNLSIFHARDGFTDEPGKGRHLLRLWLRNPDLAWKTPAQLQDKWKSLYDDVTEEEQDFPLEARIRGGAGKTRVVST